MTILKQNIYAMLLILCALMTDIIFGQVIFTKQDVDLNFTGVSSLQCDDLNGDNNQDIIGTGLTLNEISWWENSGEDPVKWEKHIVSSDINGPSFIATADFDKDDDIDIVASSWDDNSVWVWYNEGGNPVNWADEQIASYFINAHEVRVSDIDNDGLIDIVGAAAGSSTITWWKNPGGKNLNWDRSNLTQSFGGVRSVFPEDLDNDGNIDIVAAAFTLHDVAYWKNNGDGTWDKFIVDENFIGAHMVNVSDLNADGQMDIIAAGYSSDSNSGIAYWINKGGTPINWEKHSLDSQFNGALAIYAADIDNDLDPDIVGSADILNDVILWINVDSDLDNWIKIPIDSSLSGAWPVIISDLDNDGKKDIIAGGNNSGDIYWWQNSTMLDIKGESLTSSEFKLMDNFPNPFNPRTTINWTITSQAMVTIAIYDISGRLVRKLVNEIYFPGNYSNVWDGKNDHDIDMPSGVYQYQMKSNSTNITKSLVLIR